MKSEKRNLRALALKTYLAWESAGKYANLSLSSPEIEALSQTEKATLTALFYTMVEKKITLEYRVSALSGRAITDLSDHTRALLTLGMCELSEMSGTPDYAAVNECVSLAKNPGERSLVNAVLRAAVRAKASGGLPLPDRKKNLARYLSVRESFSLPIVRRLLSLFGEEKTEKLLAHYNEKTPLTVAVNLAKTTRDAWLDLCKTDGVEAVPTENSPIGVRVLSTVPPTALPGFSEGLFFVQDEASGLAALALGAKAGDTVADVCAAPGGKTFAIASLTEGKAKQYAFDLHESKLSLISSSAERLGFAVTVTARDARTNDPSLIGKCDRVLCDVPCSGLGVLGKKPDLRYKDLSECEELQALQKEILSAAKNYLKDGGRIVYSTCTLDVRENEEVVARFLEEAPEFSLVPFTVGTLTAERGTLTLVPTETGTDGFFIALMEKRKERS